MFVSKYQDRIPLEGFQGRYNSVVGRVVHSAGPVRDARRTGIVEKGFFRTVTLSKTQVASHQKAFASGTFKYVSLFL